MTQKKIMFNFFFFSSTKTNKQLNRTFPFHDLTFIDELSKESKKVTPFLSSKHLKIKPENIDNLTE